MKKKRVVIPANMGRGIKANTALSQYEVDLADYVDGTTVTYNNGKLGAVIPAPTPATEIKVKAVKEADGDVVITNQDDSTVEVPAIKVKATKEADGKVVITNQDGSTVEIEKSAPASGLDCATIDALPEKPWKKGTTLLAKQDGECIRLAAFDSIFQEVGVGITADKTNSFTNEEYKVVVTVSNTGEGKNELTNLNIVGPANTADYEIKDVTFTKSEADEVEQVDNLTYNIRGLKKGGTVKVKYTVVPKVKGTYQFTAAVNPNSTLDKDLGNNNATLLLRADLANKAITGKSCPAITLIEKATNSVMVQMEPVVESGNSVFASGGYRYLPEAKYINVITGRNTLKGMTFTSDVDITAITRAIKTNRNGQLGYLGTHDGSINIELDNIGTGGGQNFNSDLTPNAVHAKTTNSITVSGREITVTEDVNAMTLLIRPRDASCYWQAYVIFCETVPKAEKISVTNLNGGKLSTKKTPSVPSSRKAPQNIVGTGLQELELITDGYVEKQVVTVKKGTASTATLDFGKLTKFYSSGLVEITANGLAVSADAKPTDSISSTYLDVIIEE